MRGVKDVGTSLSYIPYNLREPFYTQQKKEKILYCCPGKKYANRSELKESGGPNCVSLQPEPTP